MSVKGTLADNRKYRDIVRPFNFEKTEVTTREFPVSYNSEISEKYTRAENKVSAKDQILKASPLPGSALPLGQGCRSINAVVVEVGEAGIGFSCILPSGERRIRLPDGLVPQSLRSFGAPVRISLLEIDGIRRTIVEARNIDEQRARDAIDEWVDAL